MRTPFIAGATEIAEVGKEEEFRWQELRAARTHWRVCFLATVGSGWRKAGSATR